MKLAALEIPDNPADWPEWLETQLISVDLAELVAELQVLVGERNDPPTLDDICGAHMDAVLNAGLKDLSDEQLRLLLKYPRLLFSLQERVLVDGGEYWQQLSVNESRRQQLGRHWEAISAQLTKGGPNTISVQPTRRSRAYLTAVLATIAATLVIAVGLWMTRPSGPTWGFDRDGLLTADVSPARYFESLAGAANEWFNKEPDDAESLAQRLREFQHGCETLIAAGHPQLSEDDREWLIGRCRDWKGKIEVHLDDLEGGTKSFDQVQEEANATIQKLIGALRGQANSLG